MENFKQKVILIHPSDNVLVATETLSAGETIQIGKAVIIIEKTIFLGHKIAGKDIRCGEKIIKYGVPIGTAKTDIAMGSHIHIHNIKSNYIPTYTLEKDNTYGK